MALREWMKAMPMTTMLRTVSLNESSIQSPDLPKYSLTVGFDAVGLSRQHTAENRRPGALGGLDNGTNGIDSHSQETVTNGDPYGLDAQKTITNGTDGRLFTEEELSNAMTQSTLKPSRKEQI